MRKKGVKGLISNGWNICEIIYSKIVLSHFNNKSIDRATVGFLCGLQYGPAYGGMFVVQIQDAYGEEYQRYFRY